MRLAIWNRSGNNANQYPACLLSLKYCSFLRSWTFPDGVVKMVCHNDLRRVCESSSPTQQLPGHLLTVTPEECSLLGLNELSKTFSVQDQGCVDQMNCHIFVRRVQRCLIAAGCRSRHLDGCLDGFLTIAATAHVGTKTGTISTHLMGYWLMSPWSASTTINACRPAFLSSCWKVSRLLHPRNRWNLLARWSEW